MVVVAVAVYIGEEWEEIVRTISTSCSIALCLCFGCAATRGGDGNAKPPESLPPPAAADAPAVAEEPAAPPAVSAPPAPPKLYGENDGAVTSQPGEIFVVELAANRTTPFEWVLELDPASPVVLRNQSYEARKPEGCGEGCVGYGGTERFELEAQSVGSTTLKFRYMSITNKTGAPRRAHDVAVTVAP